MKALFQTIYLNMFIIILILPINVLAETDNTVDWDQYRYDSSNNPVITNNSLNDMQTSIQTENQIRSTPVIIDDKVFIGNHNSGNLSAFDLETGEQLWENQAPNWVHSEMIYADDQLFVGYGNRFARDNVIRGTGNSGLLSLDPETGDILWNFETDGEVMPTPALYDDTVYITTGDQHLYGVDPDKGTEKWSLNLGSVISMSSPNIKDGILYVGGSSTYSFKAVDLDERKIKWETPIEGVMAGLDDVPPVISDDGLVYTTGVKNTEDPLTLQETYESDGAIATYKQMVKSLIGLNRQRA